MWHFPLLYFLRKSELAEIIFIPIFIALTFLFSIFSFNLVERPFRVDREKFKNILTLKLFLCGLVIFFVISLWIKAAAGFVDRERWDGLSEIIAVKDQVGDGQKFWREIVSDSSISPMGAGLLGAKDDSEIEVVLWGDSFGGSILMSIDELLQRQGDTWLSLINDGCTPLVGLRRIYDGFGCSRDLNRGIFDEILSSPKIKTVVLVGNFSKFLGVNSDENYFLNDQLVQPQEIFETLTEMVRAANAVGKRFVLVGDPPSFSEKIPDYLIDNFGDVRKLDDRVLKVPKSALIGNYGFDKYQLSMIPGVEYLSSLDLFCQSNICDAILDSGIPIVVDESHLSKAAADIQAQLILQLVR